MKTRYFCEVCGCSFEKASDAIKCEAQTTETYQVGTIYNNPSPRNFYKNMTFVVARNTIDRHSNVGASWGFRDNSAGDSLDLKDICGGTSLRLCKEDKPDPNHPTFKRALAFLKKHKIKPYIWDGTKSIPYEQP